MATKGKSIKRKTTKKATKSVRLKKGVRKGFKKSAIKAMYGEEPTWEGVVEDQEDFRALFHDATQWYRMVADKEDFKTWSIDYLKYNGDSFESIAKDVPADKFHVVGTMSRMLIRGCPFSESMMISYKKLLDKLKTEEPVASPRKVSNDTKTIPYITEIEQKIDAFLENGCKTDFDPAEYINTLAVAPPVKIKIVKHFKDEFQEIEDVLNGDEELKEGYKFLKRGELKRYYKLLEKIVGVKPMDSIRNKKTVKKSVKKVQTEITTKVKPTKKKPVTKTKAPKKKVKKVASAVAAELTYMEKDSEANVKSVHPTDVNGKKHVFLWNAARKNLSELKSESGFTVVKSKITNVSEGSRKRVKNPGDFFKSKGYTALKKAFDALDTKGQTPTSRINENMVIVIAE